MKKSTTTYIVVLVKEELRFLEIEIVPKIVKSNVRGGDVMYGSGNIVFFHFMGIGKPQYCLWLVLFFFCVGFFSTLINYVKNGEIKYR